MFWRMAGLSTASPVETILDKGNFTLEDLLDEDEIIQECKALNSRLINFLRERPQVEKLIHYMIEEAPEDADKRKSFKFPFISCEIFTCEVDIIVKTLVEDEELMNLLFSFLDPNHSHSTLLAGYFSKVVICLLLRKTVPLMNYIQAHQEIIKQLVDLIGITSIMEVLIRLIGADEHIYANYADAMRWLEDTNVLEMIVDKFSSSDCPEVHANAAETLCAITRYAPAGIAANISSSSFIRRLFDNALEESRPKSVLVNSLSVCISLLDLKRVTIGTYHAYNRQFSQGPSIAVNLETIEDMLGSLDRLLKLLDVSSEVGILLTTYGKLQPPLGKHRLKIIEFASVLISAGNEAIDKDVVELGVLKRILDMFLEYPYNNFLHHHVESIIQSCFERKTSTLTEHLIRDCSLVEKILENEKNPLLSSDFSKPTVCDDGRQPPRIGNIGHLTRISNKLVHLANTSGEVQTLLQENNEWADWCSTVLSKRNAVENVSQWACGRPYNLQDRGRDSEDDDYQDKDYDVAALANNLSQAFHYGIYNNDADEGQGSLERDNEDMYFDDESAEVVISSLRLGDNQESGSLFTKSNWFAYDDNHANDDTPSDSSESPSPDNNKEVDDREDDDSDDTATSSQDSEPFFKAQEPAIGTPSDSKDVSQADTAGQTDWVDWRETSADQDANNAPQSSQSTFDETMGTGAATSRDLGPQESTEVESSETEKSSETDYQVEAKAGD